MTSSSPPTLDAAIARAGEAQISASINTLRSAFSTLQESLKAGGYELPAPPAPPPAAPTAKPAAGAAAPKAAAGRAAPPSRAAPPGRAAASAKPAAKPAAAAPARTAKAAPAPARVAPAAKPAPAGKGAAPAKPAATPAAPPKTAGKLTETKLEISPAKPGVPVSCSVAFKPSLELPAKATITLALPGFTVPAQPSLPISTPSGLTAAAVADPPSVVFTVEPEKKLGADTLVEVKFSDPAVITAPEKGLNSADQAKLLTLAADGEGVAVAASAVESTTTIRASQMAPKLQAAALQLGWLLVEAGPAGWGRGDHGKVAAKVFRDVFEDAQGVDGREREAAEAAAGVLCCARSTKMELDPRLKRLVPAMPEKEGGKEGGKEGEEGKEGEGKEEGEAAAAAKEAEAKVLKEAEEVVKALKTEGLCKQERVAVARCYIARGDFDQALALLEGAGMEVARAQAMEQRYLHVLNHNPELAKLESLLEELCGAYKAAAEKVTGEGAARAWLGAGLAKEEMALVHEVYFAAEAGGQEAGADQAATDSANMDEIKAILKNRGVFGKPTLEEQIKELEQEYHDNVNFGLHSQAEIVAALLEWFRAYRTRQERGGEVYGKKEEAKEEQIVGKEWLEEAVSMYKKALGVGGGGDVALWQPAAGGEATLQLAVARVQCKLRDWAGAIESVGKVSGAQGVEAGLVAGIAEMERGMAMGMAGEGAAGKKAWDGLKAALEVFGEEGRRLVGGESRLVQSVTLLCATPLRPYNLALAERAVQLGGNGTGESASLLESAMLGLEGVPSLGMSLGMKNKASTIKVKMYVVLAKAFKNSGKKKSAWDLCCKIHDALRYASKSEKNLEAGAAASEVGVEVWEGSSVAQGRRGEALWLLREKHPQHKDSAELLDQAEQHFRKAMELEKKTTTLPADPAPAPAASSASVSATKAPAKPAATARPAPASRAGARPAAAATGKGPAANLKAPTIRPAGAGAAAASPEGAEKAAAAAPAAAAGGGGVTNGLSLEGRMGVAQILFERAGGDATAFTAEQRGEIVAAYEKAIEANDRDIEPYMKIGEILDIKDPKAAAAIFAKFPLNFDAPDKDDSFIAGEVVRLLMRGKDYTKWKKGCEELLSVGKGLMVMALVQGLEVISLYVEKLEAANHTGILCEIYAAANKRTVDDEEMKKFFRLKGWLIDSEALKASIHHARMVRGMEAL